VKPKQTTVYLKPDLYKALKVRAAETDQSLSELVSGAVRRSLEEDAKDLAVFKQRAREPNLACETVLKDRGGVDEAFRRKNLAVEPVKLKKLAVRLRVSESEAMRRAVDLALARQDVAEGLRRLRQLRTLKDVYRRLPK